MALPFDLQRFSSEIATALAVLAATRLPAGGRWLASRFRPNPDFPALKTRIGRGEIRITSAESGELTFHLWVTNLSSRRIEIEHVQVGSWTFDGAQMPQAEAQVSPPRLRIPKYSEGDMTVSLRLHKDDLDIVLATAVSAPNVKSNPGHHSNVRLDFVAAQKFAKVTVNPRYVELRSIEGHVAIPVIQPSLGSPGQTGSA